MKASVSKEFYSLVLLSMMRRIIQNNPEKYNGVLLQFGLDVGRRMADDFFSVNKMYEKISSVAEIEKTIKKFIGDTMEKNIYIIRDDPQTAADDASRSSSMYFREYQIQMDDDLLVLGADAHLHFLNGLLSALFSFLNEDIEFFVSKDKLKYRIKIVEH
ncbi:hypothetical protein ENBRE01_0809 [Enteropsectra breve]|nr:hypothetical protein ENBRE01_0809 [Enteropsectra breve]